jgi:hypothetical protein
VKNRVSSKIPNITGNCTRIALKCVQNRCRVFALCPAGRSDAPKRKGWAGRPISKHFARQLRQSPLKTCPTNSASHIHARPGSRRCGRVGLAIARADSARLAMAILPTFGTRARSALAGDAGEVEAMSALSSWARALGGDVNGRSVTCPGPGHSPRDRGLSVTPEPSAANGFLVHSYAGDDPTGCLDYVRARRPAFTPQGGAPRGNRPPAPIKPSPATIAQRPSSPPRWPLTTAQRPPRYGRNTSRSRKAARQDSKI